MLEIPLCKQECRVAWETDSLKTIWNWEEFGKQIIGGIYWIAEKKEYVILLNFGLRDTEGEKQKGKNVSKNREIFF